MIREGGLTLVPVELASVRGGPMGCLARAALDSDVSVADLEFGEEDEDEDTEEDDEDEEVADGEAAVEERSVEVRFLANDTAAARHTIRRWAARAGHERIWFRDQVLDLEPPSEVDGEYATTCPTCGLEISDSGPELVKFVHAVGHFPLSCFVCGAFVPQWEPVPTQAREERIKARVRRGEELRATLRAVED